MPRNFPFHDPIRMRSSNEPIPIPPPYEPRYEPIRNDLAKELPYEPIP